MRVGTKCNIFVFYQINKSKSQITIFIIIKAHRIIAAGVECFSRTHQRIASHPGATLFTQVRVKIIGSDIFKKEPLLLPVLLSLGNWTSHHINTLIPKHTIGIAKPICRAHMAMADQECLRSVMSTSLTPSTSVTSVITT